MDPLDQLVEIFAEAEEVPARIAPPDLLRTWQRLGEPSKWKEVMFGSNSEEMIFDELDRAVDAPVGTMREAWAMARNRAGQT